MTFHSDAATLEWNQNNMILRRGTSSLVINAEHVQELRTTDSEDAFKTFFLTKALQNREARRVFQSWERKDTKLLDKLYQEMIA
jgi:hypothetical protein